MLFLFVFILFPKVFNEVTFCREKSNLSLYLVIIKSMNNSSYKDQTSMYCCLMPRDTVHHIVACLEVASIAFTKCNL